MSWMQVADGAAALLRGIHELLRAIAGVGVALIAAPLRRLPPRASEYVITGCALWALVVPLLLWISWSRTGFVILMLSAAAAVALIYLLILLHPDDPF
jgi:hypothetical protein